MKLIAALCTFATIASAETEELLTWRDCLHAAREQNPALSAARETLERSRYDYLSTRSVYYPTLNGDASYRHAEADTGDGSTTSGERSSAGLDAQYTLYSGGGNRARVQRAQANVQSAEADWATQLASVGTVLKQRFAQLLFAQQEVKLTADISGRRKQNVDLVELRYESGKEHKGSYLLTKANYSNAVSDEHRAQRGLRVSQRNLATSLGRSEFDVLIADGEFNVVTVTNEPDIFALMKLTPDHRRADADVQASEASVRIAKSPFYPELVTSASYNKNGDEFKLSDENWSLGVGVSFPFYGGRKYINDLESARADARRAWDSMKDADDQTLAVLESAWADLRDALERRDVQREFLEATETRSEIARRQYAGGLLSFEDWDRIEDDLISAQKSMLASERDAVLAEAAWEKAQGVDLFEQP